MKREEGSAYVWALILLVIISLASVTIFGFLSADIRENRLFLDSKSLYYASYSGIEMGYGSLLTEYSGSTTNPKQSLLQWYLTRPINTKLSHTFDIMEGSDVVAKATVNVYRKTIGKVQWIIIESTGMVTRIPGKSLVTYMRINVANPDQVIRDGMRKPF